MNINKKNFFWYIFPITIFFAMVYFFIFSEKIYYYKYVQEKINGGTILKSFKDYDNLKTKLDLFKKIYPGNIIKLNVYDDFAKGVFANIIRFTQTNKNYKYQYRDFKKLNINDFKNLEKVINNISLEGAYYLSPEHIDKVTINLFVSDEKQKKIFLDYYKYIIDQEVDKFFRYSKATNGVSFEISLQNYLSELNLVRGLHYDFLNFTMKLIYNEDAKKNESIKKMISEHNIVKIKESFKCSFYQLGEAKYDCATLTDEEINSLSEFYLKLDLINISDLRLSNNGTKLDILNYENKDKSYQVSENSNDIKNSLFEELIFKWIESKNYNYSKFYLTFIEKGFSKKYIKQIRDISSLNNLFNETSSYLFVNKDNYNLDKIKESIFLNLKEVEFKTNYNGIISYLVFAFIFSLVAHIVYRSF